MYDKNTEAVLQMIVQISYFKCIDNYYIFREPSVSTGRADIVFVPRGNNHIPMIVDVKQDDKVAVAIDQIKNKNYINLLDGYHGKVLLVGITYDSKTLVHDSKTEYIEI